VRVAVLLLLIANLVVWAIREGGVGVAPGEPERLAQQIAPERLVIVARGEPPAVPEAAPAPPLACIAYSGLSEALADEVVPLLTRRSPELMVTRSREAVTASGHRVQIDRLASRALAERKAQELRALGVDDYTVVGSGTVWVVSLGVFSTEAAANARLAELRKRGIRSAATAAINYPDTRARLAASGPSEAVERAVAAVRQAKPELTGEACPPEAGAGGNGSGNGAGKAADNGGVADR
jgi:cell division septation protein DedD